MRYVRKRLLSDTALRHRIRDLVAENNDLARQLKEVRIRLDKEIMTSRAAVLANSAHVQEVERLRDEVAQLKAARCAHEP